MVINFSNGFYICNATYEERHLPRGANFIYHTISGEKRWITNNIKNAMRLRDYFSDELKLKIKNSNVKISPWSHGFSYNTKNTLDEYQKQACKFSLSRNNSYLALEQGLGKTVIGSVIVDTQLTTFHATKVLLIVPPFLITNWVRELNKWSSEKWFINEYRNPNFQYYSNADIVIVADSIIARENVLKNLCEDEFHLLITDEAHRFNSTDSQRSLAHNKISEKIKSKIRLSGTPERNRPIDLFNAIQTDAHNIIDHRDYFQYGTRFCAAYYDNINGFYNNKGSSNEAELKDCLRDYMLVMKLEDHIEIKKPVNQIVFLDETKNPAVKKLEKTLLTKHSIQDLVNSKELGSIAEYRNLLGAEKIKKILPLLKEEIDSSDDSFLLFAMHHSVIDQMSKALSSSGVTHGVITGKVAMNKRTEIEDKFQSGKIKVLVAQIQTMVGLNLQRGSRVKFLESSWVPSDNDQALKRCVRRGQTRQVVCQHYVVENSLDEYVLRTVLEKQETINKTIRSNDK